MSLEDGDDAVLDNFYPYQQYNRIKNHWRQSDPIANISNPQNGMIVSDSDDDKLYHKILASINWDEILQATMSFDISPMFDGVIKNLYSGSLSDPPTKAELNAIFTSPATMGEGWTGLAYDSDSGAEQLWRIAIYNNEYWYMKFTKAV